jgi:hypothetical protein
LIPGQGREFCFDLPRSHGIFTLTGRAGDSVQEWAVLVPVDGSRMRTATLNSYPMGFFGGSDAATREFIPDGFIELRQETYNTRLSTISVRATSLCTSGGTGPSTWRGQNLS